MRLSSVHHIAIIVSDYAVSRDFYVNKLGFEVIRENYRPEKKDWKLDLRVDDDTELENFKKRKYQYMAKDKEGRDVFLADSGYVLSMAQEDFKHIKFHFTSEF